jgi:hypothetical protein
LFSFGTTSGLAERWVTQKLKVSGGKVLEGIGRCGPAVREMGKRIAEPKLYRLQEVRTHGTKLLGICILMEEFSGL